MDGWAERSKSLPACRLPVDLAIQAYYLIIHPFGHFSQEAAFLHLLARRCLFLGVGKRLDGKGGEDGRERRERERERGSF